MRIAILITAGVLIAAPLYAQQPEVADSPCRDRRLCTR